VFVESHTLPIGACRDLKIMTLVYTFTPDLGMFTLRKIPSAGRLLTASWKAVSRYELYIIFFANGHRLAHIAASCTAKPIFLGYHFDFVWATTNVRMTRGK
jgi:hypothetical protein